VLRDVACILVLALITASIEQQAPWSVWLVRPLYWFLQGTLFWAVFVLGHDCGHGSFSPYGWVNDTFGLLLHSAILVPYAPWKLSHRHHHKNTGNMDKDEIFYPVRESSPPTPFMLTHGVFGLGLGWFTYLVRGYLPRPVSHLDVWHPFYAAHFASVALSVTSWCFVAGLLVAAGGVYGWLSVLTWYGVPLFVFASWLVITTFLHHNDEHVPWYTNGTWDYVRGNLSSVDRSYGLLHSVVHNIGTHQVHHLFPIIPHYHLEEATAAFRKRFPMLVRTSDEPIVPALLRVFPLFASQHRVPDDVSVFEYTANGPKIVTKPSPK